MLYVFILYLLSSVNAQFYYQQQQQQQFWPNNYNQWSTYQQNNPFTNQFISQNQIRIRGTLISDDTTQLPFNSQISVSLVDVSLQDTASRPLNTFVLTGSYRFPIPFELPYSTAQIQANTNNYRQYAIQARIEKDGQLLYINDQYTPVQLFPTPINPINVYMKRVASPTFPGYINGFTTRPPFITNLNICQLIPETGPCKASIEQYYFNSQLRLCQIFIWGGCGGNQNRFSNRYECERTCSSNQRTTLPINGRQKWIR